MPNWCFNHIVFSGNKENLLTVKKDLERPVFSIGIDSGWLAQVVTETPPWGMYWTEEEKLEKSVFDPYERACARTLKGLGLDYRSIGYEEMIGYVIGCKWDFNVDPVHISEEQLSFNFESPWSPPQIWVARIALKYKLQVDLEYEESGVDFAGKFLANGITDTGIIIESTYAQYRLANIGCLEQWLEEDIRSWCDDEDEVEEWRSKAEDWPLTESGYDTKYVTEKVKLSSLIPSS